MHKIDIVGLDLAKNIFQVHAIATDGAVVVKRQVRRSQMLSVFARLPPCLMGMEACGGAHHWAREIKALGHEVRLMPPAYVKPYVKRGKMDAGDAEAICEAVSRPTVLRHVRKGAPASAWVTALLVRRPAKVASVALANKMARIIWALLVKGGAYRRPGLAGGGVRSA